MTYLVENQCREVLIVGGADFYKEYGRARNKEKCQDLTKVLQLLNAKTLSANQDF